MIIELHLLQSFPASNLNRDDVGQPKTVTFGGALRGRISSQCLKRSARQLFGAHGLGPDETGIRTRRLLLETAARLDQTEKPSENTLWLVREALLELGFGVEAATWRTKYLLFTGHRAVEELVDYCGRNREALQSVVEDRKRAVQEEEARKKKARKRAEESTSSEAATETKANAETSSSKIGSKFEAKKPTGPTREEARKIVDGSRAADVALFGRMIADLADFNVVGASQVAHAFSTHAVASEFDYFTAVDDLMPDDEAGAGMIGAVDFNASLYYRYANVDLDVLSRNLDGDQELAGRATRAWLESFVRATPSGKQNSTAARTMPETLVTVVREHGAWNLANAFLRPVTGTDLLGDSTKALYEHFTRLNGFYGDGEIRATTACAVSCEDQLADADNVSSLHELVDRTSTAALGQA